MGDHRDATGDGGTSLIDKIYGGFYDASHFDAPVASSRTSEVELVQGVLQKILQGLSSNLFYWDDRKMRFCAKVGVHVSHLNNVQLLNTNGATHEEFTRFITISEMPDKNIGRTRCGAIPVFSPPFADYN